MAENEIMNAMINIKNILFSKPMPNIVIPMSTVGYKIYPCIDCGDSFLFESNYEHHVNRKSLRIIFKCRQCNVIQIFNNRCRLLSHIRKHGPRSIKIHVNDLKMEPLPLSEYLKLSSIRMETLTEEMFQFKTDEQANNCVSVYCLECNTLLTDKGPPNNVRAKHFLQITGHIYTCPVCTFRLPTICAFKTHLRLHLRNPPYFCTECGCLLDITSVIFPFDHDCSGFKNMKITSRCICPISECTPTLLDLNTLIEHFNNKHLKRVFDINNHSQDIKIFYKCEMCPGRLVLHNRIDSHVSSHCKNFVYLCQQCEKIFSDVIKLLNHCISLHHTSDDIINILNGINFNRSAFRLDTGEAITLTSESPESCLESEVITLDHDTIAISNSINNTTVKKNVTAHKALIADPETTMSGESDVNRDIIASKSTNMSNFKNVKSITAGFKTLLTYCDNILMTNDETSSHMSVEESLQSPSINYESDAVIVHEGPTNVAALEKIVAISARPELLNVAAYEKKMTQSPNLVVSKQSNSNSSFNDDFLKIQSTVTNTTCGQKVSTIKEPMIACHICNIKLNETWEVVKKHYSTYHREIRCVEPRINICKVDIGKYTRIQMKRKNKNVKNKSIYRKNAHNKVMTIDNIRKESIFLPHVINTFVCKKCGLQFEDKQSLEIHMVSHRDPYLSYQCVECGECFAVKYSFNIHLLIEHNISDVESYIKTKVCFYESAFEHQDFSIPEEPLSENQCSVCRLNFDNEYDFQRHFRSHGLAFLKKNLETRQNH